MEKGPRKDFPNQIIEKQMNWFRLSAALIAIKSLFLGKTFTFTNIYYINYLGHSEQCIVVEIMSTVFIYLSCTLRAYT